MSDIKNDMMLMGMPPVIVAYENFAQFMALEERVKELEQQLAAAVENNRLREALQQKVEEWRERYENEVQRCFQHVFANNLLEGMDDCADELEELLRKFP